MLASKLLSCVGGEETIYSDDVFQSFTRTGTGADSVVTTGIDMTKGYMLWSKGRSAATDHAIYDSARGVTFDLVSNSTAAQTTQATGLKAVSSTGHTVGSLAKMNTPSATYVDWIFRKSAKFFDVVTWTGNNAINRRLTHSLGIKPGFIVMKATSTTGDWLTNARDNAGVQWRLKLNTTAATTGGNTDAGGDWTATDFNLGGMADGADVSAALVNANGVQYVAYLFAHDASADGIVQCGSFTTDASGNATVNLGWEPQYLMVKRTDSASNWTIIDSARDFSVVSAQRNSLQANTTAAEGPNSGGSYQPTSTGFKSIDYGLLSATCIYIAIRRPNKPPTTGTQVYNAIARTGTGAAATVTGVGFAPDLVMQKGRIGYHHYRTDRLRGANKWLSSSGTSAETTSTAGSDITSFDMDGITVNSPNQTFVNYTGLSEIYHFFKRAPGFHSEICYTGTGSNKTEVHDLGKAPSLMIVKSRSAVQDWNVWCDGLTGTEKLVLNSTAAKVTDTTAWNSTVPTSSVISLGTAAGTNANTTTYVAYLFSSIAGIQSIGTYVGDGTTGRLINCGFTTGSRYVCIKAISTTGNWLVADTTRGIVSGSDPYLALNSTAAEVTTEDWLDPSSSGFLVNQVLASNANVNGVTYMYWSIA